MANSLPDYTKIPTPFANNGDRNTIPQQATNNGLASFAEGFPEITSLPLSDGGQPPTRADFNAIGYMSTNNIAYLQQGGIYTFDNTISQAIGGYPQGAILAYINNGKLNFLISKINNNTYNFNTNSSYIGQYWDYAVNLQDYLPLTGGTMTGDIKFNPSNKITVIQGKDSLSTIGLNSGTSYVNGGYIRCYGANANQDNNGGGVTIGASDGTEVTTILYVHKNNVTLNSDLKFSHNGYSVIRKDDNSGAIGVNSGSISSEGGYLRLFGTGYSENQGKFMLGATDGTNTKVLMGSSDGTLQWGGQRVLTEINGVADYVIQSWSDSNGNWYRIYKSGWIEQGGICSSGAGVTTTLLQAFSNTNYTLVIGDYIATSVDTGGASLGTLAHDKTTTTFKVSQISTHTTNWYACGF